MNLLLFSHHHFLPEHSVQTDSFSDSSADLSVDSSVELPVGLSADSSDNSFVVEPAYYLVVAAVDMSLH